MHKITATIGKEKYRTVIESDTHSFVTDEPLDLGGKDLGPDPGELLSASLAACTAATMKMYADRKGWDLEEAVVKVDFKKLEKTQENCFTKKITLKGNLDETQKQRLHEMASKCPIHRLLTGEISIVSEME